MWECISGRSQEMSISDLQIASWTWNQVSKACAAWMCWFVKPPALRVRQNRRDVGIDTNRRQYKLKREVMNWDLKTYLLKDPKVWYPPRTRGYVNLQAHNGMKQNRTDESGQSLRLSKRHYYPAFKYLMHNWFPQDRNLAKIVVEKDSKGNAIRTAVVEDLKIFVGYILVWRNHGTSAKRSPLWRQRCHRSRSLPPRLSKFVA